MRNKIAKQQIYNLLIKKSGWLAVLLFLFSQVTVAQITISGTTCVTAGSTYTYTLLDNCSSTQNLYWCANGGTIVGYGSCRGANGLCTVSIQWSTGNGKSINVHNYTNGASGTLNITVATALVSGTVDNTSQTINYNATPATITCSAASGGGCSSYYSYQWQQSPDNATWSDISGATSQNLSFSSGLTQNTWYRRTVYNSGSTAYSNSAVVYVIPPLQGGSISPSSQSIFSGASASQLDGDAAGGNCSNSYSYQWLISSNGTDFYQISGATSRAYSPGTLTDTRYFKRQVTCNSSVAYSSVATVNVYAHLSAGSISPSSTSINYNTSPGQITGSGSGGICGSYAYQWQVSSDNNTWSDISGATSTSYTPGNLTSTTYYRLKIVCGSETVYAGPSTITVYPPLQGGSVSPGSQTINYNTVPAQLTSTGVSGGNGTYTYQWQSSTDNSNWSNISGVTTPAYAPGALTSAIYYRVVVSSNGVSVNSSSTVVNVYPQLQGGTVSPATQATINYNGTAGQLSLSGVSGGNGTYSYQWQYSTDNNSWNAVSGATATSYTPSNVTASTYYRVAVTSNGAVAYSSTGTVNVYPQLVGGSISPATITISYNSSPGALTLSGVTGGNGAYAYQWQVSSDGSTYSNVSSATGTSYTPGSLTSTAYYRVMVTSNGVAVYSSTSIVTVAPQLTAGSISGSTGPVNYGGSPGQLTGTSATGGNCNSYSYQWQQSVDGTNYSDISGATGQNYTPASLAYKTFFRRKVTCASETQYTNALAVTVYGELIAGIISPSVLSIDANTSPGSLTGTLASGGNTTGSYVYLWQQSTDGGQTWANISGATNVTYAPGSLSATTWYRRRVTDAGNSIAYTNISIISIRSGVVSNMNYIRERYVAMAGVTDAVAASQLTDHYAMTQVTKYFDGIGRLSQTVTKNTSPLQRDVVAPVVYDQFGREAAKYLPYVSAASDGEYKSNALQEQNSYNAAQFSGEQFYYGQLQYEASPLNRVLSAYAPGQSWMGNGKGTGSQYLTNTLADNVQIWNIAATAGSLPVSAGTYDAGMLYKDVSIDERGKQFVQYSDKNGKVILKKIQLSDAPGADHTGWLCTYYIYDNLDNLRFVMQPRAVELINNSWTLSQSIADEYCFRYEYDQRNRLIIKKTPGADEMWIVYDARGRVVMTQDAHTRAEGKWLVTEYDSRNRGWRTGKLTDGNNRAYHQNLAYSSTSYPNTSSNYEVLTQVYYDDYSWVSGSGLSSTIDNTYINGSNFITSYNASPDYATPITANYNVRGMSTGAKVKVLGTTNQYLYTITFYDDKGHLIQTQSTNVTGGTDIQTMQYDFSGKVLRTVLKHQKNAPNAQTHVLLTKMSYDHAGRIKTVSKTVTSTINGQNISKPEQVLASYNYNELGQLHNKTEGSSLETLTYDYNIRGWLLGVNRDYVNDAASNYFGFELGYDKTASYVNATSYFNPQLTGKVSGTIWKSKGDNVKRKYDFTYDNANRLTSGDFNQQSGGSWSKTDLNNTTTIDFSVSNLTYDANGNILTMKQQGWKASGSTSIDDLTYAYMNNGNSNKLLAVTESTAIGTLDNKMGDFTDKNRTQDDYTYDGNGNLTADKNKNISSISYNHMNLPSQVNMASKGTITYTYDAAGIKLQKTITDSISGITTNTLYIAGFEYRNDTLQQVSQEEGRLRYAKKYFFNGDSTYQYFYDYFLKDQLGNVRMVLTDQKDTVGYYATMETGTNNAIRNKENALFSNVDASAYLAASVPGGYPTDTSLSNPNNYVAKLNGSGQKMGPAIVLKVMSGDVIDLAVKSFYRSQGGSGGGNASALSDVLSSLAGGVVSLSGDVKGTLPQLSNSSTSPLLGALNGFRTDNNPDPTGKPKAFLNWILLDERFNYVSSYPQSGAIPVGGADALNTLAYSGINITKSGYLYIYVSNETQNWDVFFDNLAIKHYSGPIMEENHYYPFGLTMAGLSDKALKPQYRENKHRFNDGAELQNKEFSDGSGLELYQTEFRMLDPQIGRFCHMDPLADVYNFVSPYQYALNNPVYYNDPSGANTEDEVVEAANNLLNSENGGEWDKGSNGGSVYKFTSQDEAFTAGASATYFSGYWGAGQDAANGFYSALNNYNAQTGGNLQLMLPVLDVGIRVNGNWFTRNENELQHQLYKNGAMFNGFFNNYVNPFLEASSFVRNSATIGVIPGIGASWVYETEKATAVGSEIATLKTIKTIGKVAENAGRVLGLVSAVEHGVNAYKDFEKGDYLRGALNTLKVAADIGLMFAKANPVGIVLTLGYAIFDLYTSDDD